MPRTHKTFPRGEGGRAKRGRMRNAGRNVTSMYLYELSADYQVSPFHFRLQNRPMADFESTFSPGEGIGASRCILLKETTYENDLLSG